MSLFRETAEDLKQKLALWGVADDERIAVAVSGGADSMALALLLNSFRPIHALVVDHQLREGSEPEAAWVCSELAAHNIKSTRLICEWPKNPVSNMQAAARAQRYKLMADWCHQHDARFLLTGHHMEDQAETLILRLARGSGVYGLAGMSEKRALTEAVTLLRPMLNISKHSLRSCLQELGQTWVEDPSNKNEAFERVKARRMLVEPPLDGLTPQRLADTATRLRRTRDALEHYEQEWLKNHVTVHHAARYAELALSGLSAVPGDIVLRGLKTLIQQVSGAEFGVRFEKLERLFEKLVICHEAQEPFPGQTLGGVQILASGAKTIFIVRELAAVEERRAAKDGLVWDRRYTVNVGEPMSHQQVEIGAIGPSGTQYLYSLEDKAIGDTVASIPKQALASMPCIWLGDKLVAVPQLGLMPGINIDTLEIRSKPLLTEY